ncbi:hypothetical protein 15570_00008 [Lokiarchaeota virus WyrdV1]|nr:hypothetical protein 15570_00008 [Lokiarchaeota virus WyrdV1]
MTTNLITFICQGCGTKVLAHIDREGVLRFSIRDKLIGSEVLLNDLGYYVCVDCHKKSVLRFRVFD